MDPPQMSYPVAQAIRRESADDVPHARDAEPPAGDGDPFHERRACRHVACMQVLGGRFRFESDSEALLRLVEAAYGGLPSFASAAAPEFRIELSLVSRHGMPGAMEEPPPVRTHAGAGFVCATMDASNYAVLFPAQRRGFVVASQDMLEYAYHLRYELIEFAVFVLAARGMGLVPLHGACVGRHGRGVLLLGASGAGKSTLALHGLLHGLDFLSEDAVFAQPESLRATGVANYLHLRTDALRLVDGPTRAWLGAAPTIRRRSGVEKFEVDVRHGPRPSTIASLELAAAVFVCGAPAADPGALLSPVPAGEIPACLAADQAYAAGQPGWDLFTRQLQRRGVYRLARGRHPQAAVDALLQLLD
jgi:hypothetical protein